jgi:hypothetical protein
VGEIEISAESSRGAKALIDAARSVRTYNRMTQAEATRAGIERPRSFFRVIRDKSNMTRPADKPDWYQIQNVQLANGDNVGIVTRWEWPDVFAGITADDLLRVQHAVHEKNYRASNKANDWVGHIVAEVLGLKLDNKKDRARVNSLLTTWIDEGALRVIKMSDAKGTARPVIVVGTWAA